MKIHQAIYIVCICNIERTRKAQLTQRGTRDSGACLKAHREQI